MKSLRTLIATWALSPRSLHPETALLVFRFARALAEKLAAAEKKYGYDTGWSYTSDEWPKPECQLDLLRHIKKGDPRDVAAFCAFLWHHGERTVPADPIENCRLVAVHDGSGESATWSLEVRDSYDQELVAMLRWPSDWPREVDDAFLRDRGFTTVVA